MCHVISFDCENLPILGQHFDIPTDDFLQLQMLVLWFICVPGRGGTYCLFRVRAVPIVRFFSIDLGEAVSSVPVFLLWQV